MNGKRHSCVLVSCRGATGLPPIGDCTHRDRRCRLWAFGGNTLQTDNATMFENIDKRHSRSTKRFMAEFFEVIRTSGTVFAK